MPSTTLFQPARLGSLDLPNRVVMAPLTRQRAAQPGNVPQALNVKYYTQRANAGLIISEGVQISPEAQGYAWTPGIHSAEQIDGWKAVTDSVHNAGGRIFLQLWHVGRISHTLIQPNGQAPVAPSAIAAKADVYVQEPDGSHHKAAASTPRALETAELPQVVETYAQATRNALQAGFDGVEIHAANGYLLDQFLRDSSNHREGPYGGQIENRARLLLEVIEAVSGVFGSENVGVRLSPLNSFQSMKDSDPVGLVTWLAKRLNDYGLAFVHLMRSDFFGEQQADVITPVREHFKGKLILNMGYTGEEAEQAIESGLADAVAFGVPFIANPDLPERLKLGTELNEADPATFYSQGAEGYIDYPYLERVS